MPVLSTWTPEGGVLGFVAPLALGAAAGTALVVDLDPAGPRYPGEGSLAKLVADGPTRRDLVPARTGVAVLRNGGVGERDSSVVVAAICRTWPAVVLRLAPTPKRPEGPGVVPVRPLLPGGLQARDDRPAVYLRCGWRVRPFGPGPVLPAPSSATVRALLEGRRPASRRWVLAWRRVWESPWT